MIERNLLTHSVHSHLILAKQNFPKHYIDKNIFKIKDLSEFILPLTGIFFFGNFLTDSKKIVFMKKKY
jgi:hypothetical protein